MPQISDVRGPRSQCCAYAFSVFAGVLVALHFVFSAVEIWSTRLSPPTISASVDGSALDSNGIPLWGRMPIIDVENSADPRTHGTVISMAEGVWGEHCTGVRALEGEQKVVVSRENGRFTANMSHMVPTFEGTFAPSCYFRVHMHTNSSDPNYGIYIRGLGQEQHFVQSLRISHGQNHVLSSEWAVRKSIVPRREIAWGFPGEQSHTDPLFELNELDRVEHTNWHPPAAGETQILFMVRFRDPTLPTVKPLTIRARIQVVVFSFGGLIATYTTLFHLVFKRRNPRSPVEDFAAEMTLRFGGQVAPRESAMIKLSDSLMEKVEQAL